jgi:hypothetical protein
VAVAQARPVRSTNDSTHSTYGLCISPRADSVGLIRSKVMQRLSKSVDEIILSIDGLQPEKGRETLHVVRELIQKRMWFAEPLISATADEVRRLIKKAKEWAEFLDKVVPGGPYGAMPRTGAQPPQGHEEDAIQEERAVIPGRIGATLSRCDRVLALSRVLKKNSLPCK